MFEKTQFYKSVDRHNVYISVHDAVQHSTYIEETTIEVGFTSFLVTLERSGPSYSEHHHQNLVIS